MAAHAFAAFAGRFVEFLAIPAAECAKRGVTEQVGDVRQALPPMSMAIGFHARCGNEDTLYGPDGNKMTSVQQIEQLVRVAKELGREVATGKEAREIYKIGVQYNSVEETLAQLGMPPNREPGRRALPNRYAA